VQFDTTKYSFFYLKKKIELFAELRDKGGEGQKNVIEVTIFSGEINCLSL